MASGASALISQLAADLDAQRLSDSERTKLLEQLKVIGRDSTQAAPIFERTGIVTLCKYAFDTGISSASREAMRCLANAMLLNEPSRQLFIDLDYPPKAAERLKTDDRDDEFLVSRIIFFSTYTGKLDIPPLIEKNGLSESIIKNLDRAVARIDSKAPEANPITPMALQESLKLITNISHFSATSTSTLVAALSPLTTLLLRLPLPNRPLQPPTTLLINAILMLNPPPAQLEDATLRDPLFPPSSPTALTDRLVDLLSLSLPDPLTPQADTQLSPLISLLRNLHASAPQSVREDLKSKLLPPPSARSQPLGSGSALPSRLLRTSTDPSTSTLKDLIGALLYELSSSSASELVHNIGYGYAIGILTRLGVGRDATALHADSGINPVTGQTLATEPAIEDMTDEEKEREAERLFVLFERLKGTGVVDVKNPVELMRERES